MEDLKEKVIDLYINQGYGQNKTASLAGCSAKKVVKILKENGYQIRTMEKARKKTKEKGRINKPEPYTSVQEKIVLQCYVKEKRGIKYCQKQANCSLNTFNQILKDNNIQKRTYAEAAIKSNQNRALYKNKEYFSKESSNMAWLLGFLAADGYISKSDNAISIALCDIDREILERIKTEVEIENKIRDYEDHRGYKNSELRWACAQHKQELAKYSIIPNKTFQLKPPYLLSKKYWIDYIRGYFDGDGSVNFISANGKKKYTARWQVCSATTEILQFILDTFEEYGIPPVSIQKQDRKGHILYCIQYSTNSTKKIYDILYNTSSTLFLQRKKDHFEEIIKKIQK